jgi:hypothetical protein
MMYGMVIDFQKIYNFGIVIRIVMWNNNMAAALNKKKVDLARIWSHDHMHVSPIC